MKKILFTVLMFFVSIAINAQDIKRINSDDVKIILKIHTRKKVNFSSKVL